MTVPGPIVLLVDVDNTLINNDRVQNDIKRYLDREFGVSSRERAAGDGGGCRPGRGR